MSNVDVVMD